MSGMLSPHHSVLEAARRLGASKPIRRALVVGSKEWAQWTKAEFSPAELHQTDAAQLTGVETSGAEPGYDLIVVGEGLESGTLSETLGRLGRLSSMLSHPGVGLIMIRPMAHPVSVDDGPTPVGPFDALLFPHAARMGDLGPTIQKRLMLSPLSWRYLLEQSGFSLIEMSTLAEADGSGLRQAHGSRLVHFDDDALCSGAVTALVRVDGDVQ